MRPLKILTALDGESLFEGELLINILETKLILIDGKLIVDRICIMRV